MYYRYKKKGMKMIVSDIIWVETSNPFDVEKTLISQYGKLIRWAIIDIQDNKFKICLSYEKAGS